MRGFYFFAIIFSSYLCFSQTEGVGYSAIYSLKENVDALNEALFNAQENAAINSGGNIGFIGFGQSTDSLSESNTGKTSSIFNSNRRSLHMKMVKAVVKTIDGPRYDTIWLSKKKYKVKASGKFMVEHDKIHNLLPELDKLGEKINVEVQEYDCRGRFYDYSKEYFRQKQNSIFLSRQKFPLGDTDFGIEVFTDRIALIDKRTSPNVSVKIIKLNNCNEVITDDFISNDVLDEIREEIFYYYLIK
jgi:hypothetical protein